MSTPTREETAQFIIKHTKDYKICLGCGSIVPSKTNICNSCQAYKFNTNKDSVINQAILLATKEPRAITPESLVE